MAARKSIAVSRLSSPSPISGFRSPSAWKQKLKPVSLTFRSSPAQSARSCQCKRVAGLDLLVAAILVRQVSFDLLGMLRKEDRAIDLRQGANRGIGIKDSFGGPPIPKILGDNVKTNSRSSHVIPTVANLNILVGRHHPIESLLILSDASRSVCR